MAVRVAVVGYASADRPVSVDSLPAPDTTAVVRERLGSAWPRLGGCGPQIAVGLAARGVETACVTWLAEDEVGRSLRAQLDAAGVDPRGIARAGERTAESYLVYDGAGRSLCFFDPGEARVEGLTDGQRDAVAEADLLCLTVAPAAATRAALDAGPGARVVWSVKADPDAYPPDLVSRLLTDAEAIWHSEREAGFLGRGSAAPRDDALVVTTHGPDGASWRRGAEGGREHAVRLRVADTTGAGDAFVAGSLAQLLREPTDSAGAVRAGIAASRALLEARGGVREES